MDSHTVLSASVALIVGLIVGWVAKGKWGAAIAADEAHIASEAAAYRARIVADAEKAEAEVKKAL
jgi:hypothetical protein